MITFHLFCYSNYEILTFYVIRALNLAILHLAVSIDVLGIDNDEVMQYVGGAFVEYIDHAGYGKTLKVSNAEKDS